MYVTSGTHRVPALIGLGYVSIPMVVRYPARRVRIEDAGVWPGVLCGDFSRDEAEALYERVFAGRDPDWLAEAIGSSEYGAIMEAFGGAHWSGQLSSVG
jgi:ParB-like chromosome segregation protein Spo0J